MKNYQLVWQCKIAFSWERLFLQGFVIDKWEIFTWWLIWCCLLALYFTRSCSGTRNNHMIGAKYRCVKLQVHINIRKYSNSQVTAFKEQITLTFMKFIEPYIWSIHWNCYCSMYAAMLPHPPSLSPSTTQIFPFSPQFSHLCAQFTYSFLFSCTSDCIAIFTASASICRKCLIQKSWLNCGRTLCPWLMLTRTARLNWPNSPSEYSLWWLQNTWPPLTTIDFQSRFFHWAPRQAALWRKFQGFWPLSQKWQPMFFFDITSSQTWSSFGRLSHCKAPER